MNEEKAKLILEETSKSIRALKQASYYMNDIEEDYKKELAILIAEIISDIDFKFNGKIYSKYPNLYPYNDVKTE